MSAYTPDWKLATIPDAAFQSEAGRRRGAMAKNRSGGPKPKPTACPKCGQTCDSAGAAKVHCKTIRPSANT